MTQLLKVLVAEDDRNDRFLLEQAFAEAGVSGTLRFVQDGGGVVAYLSGEGEFADRTRFPYPDLVLLDIKMPKLDGFQVLKWIRGRAGLGWLTVIMFSGSALDEDVRRAFELGANSYLQKPCNSSELVAMLRSLDSYWRGYNVFQKER